jgi:hypothetical protein
LVSTTYVLESAAYGDPGSNVCMTMSTSWMTASGLPFEAIKDLFLRGDADALDPRNAPLLVELRTRYGTKASGVRGGTKDTARTQSDDIAPPPYELRDERLRLLRQRDRLLRKLDLPKNAFEARLMTVRIPTTEFETKQRIRRINIEVRDEEANAADREVLARNRTSRVIIVTAAFTTTSGEGDTLCVRKTRLPEPHCDVALR